MPLLTNHPEKREDYDRFMQEALLPNILQAGAWSAVKDNWGSERIYVEKDGKIVAAASLLIKRLLGQTLLYSPRGFVVAPFDAKETSIETEHFEGERAENLKALIAEIDAYAKSVGAYSLAIDPEIAKGDASEDFIRSLGFKQEKDPMSFIQPRYLAWLDIQKSDEELMAFFSSKTRYNIKLAEKKGVYVKEHGIDAIPVFFELHKIMAKRNDIAIRGEDYYYKLMNTFPDSRVFIAYHEEEPLAAAILINYCGTAWYAYGASSNSKRNFMPNQLMQWVMIQWAKQRGAIRYDFGGFFYIDPEDGLYRFKSGFTGKENNVELIGEYEKVYKPLVYAFFSKALPLGSKLLKFINRRK
ncbi:MAG: peptidoglycan bridge formation glycyltransferase FemA/FemB family protein [Bacillota bacterium]|nr:peptidoglycan bridge formation glycyltransferase FemA/FemB family protein [Bacillota bacterium]